MWGEPVDEERIARTLRTDIPAALDYLERELPENGFLFDRLGLADIAIASFFRNAAYADFSVDPQCWPRTARLVKDVLAAPVFEKLFRLEQIQLNASIAGRRQALLDAGARLTEESWGTREPRHGVMRL